MFNRKKKEQRLMAMVNMIKPTSKSALKQQCLYLCRMDVRRAQEMYDFLVKDMEELPAIDPVQKSWMQNVGGQVSDVFDWIRNNQDMLSQGYELIKSISSRKQGTPPTTPLPPING